jgi:hypothetical protein
MACGGVGDSVNNLINERPSRNNVGQSPSERIILTAAPNFRLWASWPRAETGLRLGKGASPAAVGGVSAENPLAHTPELHLALHVIGGPNKLDAGIAHVCRSRTSSRAAGRISKRSYGGPIQS